MKTKTTITKSKAVAKKSPIAKKALAKKAPAKRKTTAVARIPKAIIPTNGKAAISALEKFIEQRGSILAFVHDSLVRGRDFGITHPKAQKEEIWKSGCEKVISWLQLATPKFFRDQESWEMMGSPAGTIMLRCYLVRTANMKTVFAEIKKLGVEHEEMVYRQFAEAEGRGAASTDEGRVFDANACVKKCEIRCQKDAVLRLGLSGEFGQDEADFIEAVEAAHKAHDKATAAYAEPKRKIKPEAGADVEDVETIKGDAEVVEPKDTELEKLGKEAYRILNSGKVNSAGMVKKFTEIVDRAMKAGNIAAVKGAINTMNTSK